MKKPLPLRHRLMWLALVMLGAVVLFPSTRSLLWTHLRIESLVYGDGWDPAAERAFAAGVPNDYPVQLALAAESANTGETNVASSTDPMAAPKARNRRIEALAQRFPNSPSVYANLLRYMTLEEVRLYQAPPENAPPDTPGTTPAPPSPETLAMFAAAAQKGAQLDPDNAYFPMMQAIGLFTVHRDSEALDALRAAGQRSQWREYFTDEFEGSNRLESATFARWRIVQRFRNIYSLQFPQYAQLRAVARAAVKQAAEEERNGRVAEGVAIRHALMRSGGLLRAQGTTAISALVGIAIANIATQDPGGALGLQGDKSKKTLPAQERRDRYYAYLNQKGRGPEAAWAGTEMIAGVQAKEIVLKGTKNPVFTGLTFVQYSVSWLLNLVLFCSTVAMLILGGQAYYATLFRKVFPAEWLPRLRCGYTLAAIGCIGFWQWAAISDGLLPISDLVATFDSTLSSGQLTLLQGGAFSLSLLVPALFVGLIAIMSRKQQVPLATGLGRGLRGAAFPVAAVLFLGYGLSLLPTAYLEAKITQDCTRTMQNEPRYFAEMVGKAWPSAPTP